MRRQKRKADTIQLNFVEPTKSKRIAIRKVSFSLEGGVNKATQVQAERQLNSSNEANPEHDPLIDFTLGFDANLPLDEVDNIIDGCGSSAHTARKLKAAEAWTEIRAQFVPTLVEVSGFPSQLTLCSFCESSIANVRCAECGVSAFLCEECAVQLHGKINKFHNPLLWKVSMSLYTN